MEPPKTALRKRYRLVLQLGKFQVIERSEDMIKIKAWNNTVTLTDPILARLDIKAGDILTFYTEAPLADLTKSSVQ